MVMVVVFEFCGNALPGPLGGRYTQFPTVMKKLYIRSFNV